MLRFLLAFLLCIESAHSYVPSICMQHIPRANRQDRRQFIGKTLLATPLIGLGLIKKTLALTPDEINQIAIYEKTLPSVCMITTEYNVSQQSKQPKGLGTGFVYDSQGHIVTNFHVVNRCVNATVKFTDMSGKVKEYIPRLTGYDQDKDIAVLKIDNLDAKPISLNYDKNIRIGQYCYAVGHPLGKQFSYTMGIISALNRELTSPSGKKIANIIQADVPINKGNSGGPLIDSSGQILGINTAILSNTDTYSGISLAISVDTMKKTVDNIIENGIIDHPTLGIEYFTQLPSKLDALNTGIRYVEKGVIILRVLEGSAAAVAGLQGLKQINATKATLGDVIIGIDENQVNNSDEMLEILDKHKPKDKIKVKVLRGNNLEEVMLDIILDSSVGTLKLGIQL